MRKAKVLHIITRMSKGGAQENTLLNVSRVNPEQFESHLLSGPSEGPEGDILDKVEAAQCPFTVIPELVREPDPAKDLLAYRKLHQFMAQNKFDIVHTHTSKAGILGRWAAYWNRVPVIIHSSHSHVFYGYFGKVKTVVFKSLEKAAARITDSLQELTSLGIVEHLQHGVGKEKQFRVVYSGQNLSPFLSETDPEQRAQMRESLGLNPDHIAVICVARLTAVKGYSTLFTAFAKAAKQDANLQLLVAGSGDLEADLKQQVQDLNIGERVQFLGLRHDIAELLTASDMFAMASLNEGLGRALVEASASGLPCVSSKVGGIPEVVLDGKTGILASAEDSDAFADAILQLAGSPDLRRSMGAAGKDYVHPKFSIESMIETIEDDYLNCLQNKHPDFRN